MITREVGTHARNSQTIYTKEPTYASSERTQRTWEENPKRIRSSVAKDLFALLIIDNVVQRNVSDD